MAPHQSAHVFFRIVRSDSPVETDFFSLAERGRPLPANVKPPELWEGVSVYDTETQARRIARLRPYLGAFLARVEIEPGSSVRIARTGGTPGHHTLWTSPWELLSRVTAVMPV